jgi:hypothetical protein
MSETVCRIEKLTNGYTVEIPDAAAQANNKNPKKPYISPWKEYAFASAEEATAFVTKHLKGLEPPEEDMGTEFNRAVSEED